MKRAGIIGGIVLFWLAAMGWLVRYEAFPTRFGLAAAGYRDLFAQGTLVMSRWMTISFKDAPIGYSHTRMDVDEESTDKQTTIENETFLRMQILGAPQQVRVSTKAVLDIMHHLQTFDFLLSSRAYSVVLRGRRVRGEVFRVSVRSADFEQTFQIRIPDDAVLYSPLTEMTLQHLEPGQTLRLRVFNPASMATDDLLVRAVRRETLVSEGQSVPATLLTTQYQGMEILSWIDRDGAILRQETPFGWTMQACTAQEAIRASQQGQAFEDLLLAMSVPCLGSLPDPRKARRLRLRLSGPGVADTLLINERQKMIGSDSDGVDLDLAADVLPAPPPEPATVPPALQPYLAATPFVQSDDPEIREQAARLVAGRRDPVDTAVAICDWVFREVKKEPTVSLPSALDVLHQKRGDCNEHTYLFVALARAAGLPAKIVVGLVYTEGAFYYHAWPAVHVGRWLEMDPTFGQHGVDATHIGLLEGELANQVKLLGVLGRLHARLLTDTADTAQAGSTPGHGGKKGTTTP